MSRANSSSQAEVSGDGCSVETFGWLIARVSFLGPAGTICYPTRRYVERQEGAGGTLLPTYSAAWACVESVISSSSQIGNARRSTLLLDTVLVQSQKDAYS